MSPRPEFDPDALSALLPWREYHFSRRSILIVSALFALCVIAVWAIEKRSTPNFALLAVAGVVAVPAALFYIRYSIRGNWLIYPVGMDREGIVGPGMWGTVYVPWTNVRAVAHVVGVIGGAIGPIEANLVIYKKHGFAARLSLPGLTAVESEQLFQILDGLSRLHDFALVLSHTPEGQRWLKRAPWF